MINICIICIIMLYVKDPIFFGWFLGSQSFVPWAHPMPWESIHGHPTLHGTGQLICKPHVLLQGLSREKFWETVLSWHVFTVTCGEFCYIPSTWTCFWVKTIYFQYTSRNPKKKQIQKNSNVPSRTVLWISMDDVSSRIFCPGRPGTGLQGSPGIAPASVDHPHRWHHPAWLGQIPPTDPRASEKWSNYLEIMASHGKYMSFCLVKLCLTLGQAMTNQLKTKKCPTGWCPPVISWFINPIN